MWYTYVHIIEQPLIHLTYWPKSHIKMIVWNRFIVQDIMMNDHFWLPFSHFACPSNIWSTLYCVWVAKNAMNVRFVSPVKFLSPCDRKGNTFWIIDKNKPRIENDRNFVMPMTTTTIWGRGTRKVMIKQIRSQLRMVFGRRWLFNVCVCVCECVYRKDNQLCAQIRSLPILK